MLYHRKNSRQRDLRLFDGTEPSGEAGVVLDGLELRLRVRVVVRDPGAAEGLGEPQVGQQLGRTLSGQRSPPVGVKGQHAGLDIVLQAGLLDQAAAQRRGVSRSATIHPVT